jgi:alpha-2-macroglobulin
MFDRIRKIIVIRGSSVYHAHFRFCMKRVRAIAKRYRAVLIGLLIIAAISAGYKSIPCPRVEGVNTPETASKVSFDAPFAIHFSQPMNKTSVEDGAEIHPRVKGAFSWPDNKTLEFHPSRPPDIGGNYRITIKSQAAGIYGKSLGSDAVLYFEVTGSPFVKFISPYSGTENPIDQSASQSDTSSVPVVSSDQVITVMFDRPMKWADAADKNLLLTDPPVPGDYRFLGMSAFQFIPDSWPVGTKFRLTVPAGIPARDGGKTENETSWVIKTSSLAVTGTNPAQGDENADLNTPIEIYFSQPVDLGQIRPGVNALVYPSNDLDAAENPKNDGFFNTEVSYGKTADGRQDKSILVFNPTFPWLPDTGYKFVLKSGLAPLSGKNIADFSGTKEDIEIRFKTKAGPGVTGFTAPTNENSGIFVTFGTPMTVAGIIKNLSFSPDLPSPPGIMLDAENKKAEIICDFPPNTKYIFRLKAGMPDADGKQTAKDYKAVFTSPSARSKLRWEDSAKPVLFTEKSNPEFVLRSSETGKLVLRLCGISDKDFIRTNEVRGWEKYDCDSESRVYSLPLNGSGTVRLKLADIFSSGLRQGIYFLSVRADDGRKIHRIFFVTDTALIIKKSAGSLLVFAEDMPTGKPVPRMDLAISGYDGGEIAKGVTDGDGVYKLTRDIGEGIYVVATKNIENENRWAISQEYSAAPSGQESGSIQAMAEEPELFLVSDKNTVSGGGSFYIKGIRRTDNDAQLALPEDKNVRLTLEDSYQRILFDENLPLRRDGSFDTKLPISSSAPRGVYHLIAYNKNGEKLSSNDVSLEVSEKNPPFEMEWSGAKSDFIAGDTIQFNLNAHYAPGIPAAGLSGKWELYQKPYYFDNYAGDAYYSFGKADDLLCRKGACPEKEISVNRGEFVFDQDGAARIAPADKNGGLQAGYQYELIASARSAEDEEVYGKINFRIHPDDYYIGLSARHYLIRQGDNIEGGVVAVNPDGNLLKDKKIKISLAGSGDGGKTRYEKNIITGSDPKNIIIPIGSDMPAGIYTLRAEDQNGRCYTELKLYVIPDGNQKLADGFAIFSDQAEYFTGGKTNIAINYPDASAQNPATVLLTYERGGIIDYQVVELRAPVTETSIPVTEDMTPNVHVSAIAVDAASGARTADTDILISKPDRNINISITQDPVMPAPGEDVTLRIHTYDYQNRPVPSVVALDLAKSGSAQNIFPITPFNYFYRFREPRVAAFSNLNLPESSAAENLITPESETVFKTYENSFSAYFNPVALTDTNGYAEIKITLPDEYAFWQVSAIATNGAKNFGYAVHNLGIKERLAIQPIIPAFIIPGDRVTIGALVRNLSDEAVKTDIGLTADGFELKGGGNKSVFIQSGETVKIEWNIETGFFSGISALKLRFRSEDDSASADLPLAYPGVSEAFGGSGFLKNEWSSGFKIAQNAIKSMGGIYVSVSGTPIGILNECLGAAQKHQYPLAENLADRLLADTIIKEAGRVNKQSAEALGARMNETAVKIMSLQGSDGGFAFWDGAESDPWLTAYVSFALSKAGAWPETSENSAMRFLWSSLDKTDSVSDKFFILWALSEMGGYDTKSSIDAYQSREKSSIAGKAFLLINFNNLIKAGQKSVYPYIERLQSEIAGEKIADGDWVYFEDTENGGKDTNIRSTAVALYALAGLNDENPMVAPMVRYLASIAGELMRRDNAQEEIWVAMAMAEFIKNQLIVNADYAVSATVNGKEVMDFNMKPDNAGEAHDAFVPPDLLRYGDDANEISVKKDGEGPLWFNAYLKYFPSNDEIQPTEKEIMITRDYYSPEDTARAKPLSEMKTGNLYRGVLTLIVPEDSPYTEVEEFIPAGVKVLSLNPAVANLSSRYESEEMSKKQGLNRVKNPLWNFDSYEIKDDRLLLFAEHLPAGVYEIDYLAQAGLPGKYNHLPASVRQLFNPSARARTGGGWLEVK